MGRSIAVLVRLGIILSAAAMLFLMVGHAHAQELDAVRLVPGEMVGGPQMPAAPLQRQAVMRDMFYLPPDGISSSNPDYRLGTGDKLRLTVFGQNDLTGEYQIDGSGFIRLPLIGAVKAGGITAPMLESAVAASLARGYLVEPKVAVEITAYRPFYIIGAVGRPGQYPYVNAMTALNAVALAGGFLPSAVESAVYVRHEGDARERKIATSELTEIRPGDVVRVDTTFFWDAMNFLSPLASPLAIAAATVR